MPPTRIILSLTLILFLFRTYAQTGPLYSYQELSHIYYLKQKDSIRKAWVCPQVYKDKATQKKYKEFWDSRTDFLTGDITDDNYVHDKEIYGYIQGIINQIVQANRQQFPSPPFLLLDRSPSVNAYAIGSNVIAVNLGLITFASCKEELALVIAHELSHNILSHVENAMKEKAEWLSSPEYAKSLNAVLDSKYERLTRLKKVLEGYSFSRNRHQRYHESEADSLAILLLKKSNIPFNARFFLRLDSSDIVYKQPLKKPVRDYFAAYNLPVDDAWTKKRSKGLSTRTYNFSDTTTIEDSLKTHPDCAIRYARTRQYSTPNAIYTGIPAGIRNQANEMVIWNIYSDMRLTPCLYRIFLEKDKGNTNKWYDFMVSNIISGLYYADKDLNRFNAIGVTSKEYISKDYYTLQTMLEQIPRENLEQYCKSFQTQGFWKEMPPAEKAMKDFLYTLSLDPDGSDKNHARAAKTFIDGNSASMYCEFAETFRKK